MKNLMYLTIIYQQGMAVLVEDQRDWAFCKGDTATYAVSKYQGQQLLKKSKTLHEEYLAQAELVHLSHEAKFLQLTEELEKL